VVPVEAPPEEPLEGAGAGDDGATVDVGAVELGAEAVVLADELEELG
jgi:hypothetical protein